MQLKRVKYYKWFILATMIIIILLSMQIDTYAQCPMCKIAAETNLENGGTSGKGLNKGILYLLAMPYLLIGTIAIVWWRSQKQKKA